MDPIDVDQHAEVCTAVEDIKTTARDNSQADAYESNLKGILRDHMEIFRSSFSAGNPAKPSPLDIELTPYSKPVKFHLGN